MIDKLLMGLAWMLIIFLLPFVFVMAALLEPKEMFKLWREGRARKKQYEQEREQLFRDIERNLKEATELLDGVNETFKE